MHGGTSALVWRDTRGSVHPSAHLDRGTSAWRRWKCGDRWIDPRTWLDTSPLGTGVTRGLGSRDKHTCMEGHAGIDGSKCALGSSDKRVATIQVRGSVDRSPHLYGCKSAWDRGDTRGSMDPSARIDRTNHACRAARTREGACQEICVTGPKAGDMPEGVTRWDPQPSR